MASWLWVFWRFNGRDLWQNRLSSLLTLIGVSLGVAIVLAIQLTSQSAVSQFKDSITQLAGSANLELAPQTSNTMPETVLRDLHPYWRQGLRMRPIIEKSAIVPSAGAKQAPQVLRILAIDMLGDQDFRQSSWLPGQAPKSYLDIFQNGRFYIGQNLAERLNIKATGHTLSVWIDERKVTLQVAGILKPDSLTGAYAGQIAFMDIGPAQQLFALEGQLSRLELLVPEKQLPRVQLALQQHFAKQNLLIQKPERRGERVEQMLQSYHYNLTALSLVAVLVGGFLVYNTMAITVLRRQGQIGILRALGVSKRSVASLFIAEAALLGSVASLLGLGLGLLLAAIAVASAGSTIQALYTGQSLSGFTVEWPLLLGVFILGVGLSVAGALFPALQAALIPPASATRSQASFSNPWAQWPIGWLIASGLLLLGAIGSALQPAVNGVPLYGYVASTLGVFAIATAVPFFLQKLLRLFSYLKHWPALIGLRLGAEQLLLSLGRSSVAVASLAITLGMVIAMVTMISSFRQSVQTWVQQSLKADLLIQPLTSKFSREAGLIRPETVSVIKALPGVVATDPFLERTITYRNRLIKLGVGDFSTFLKHGHVDFVDKEAFPAVLKRVLSRLNSPTAGVIISEPLAVRLGLVKGQRIELPTPKGPLALRIEGIYHDYASDQGYIVLPRPLFARYFPEHAHEVNSVAVYLGKPSQAEAVRKILLARLPDNTLLDVRTNTEIKEQVLTVFDQTFAITYGMQAIALLIAVLTVCNTLIALVLEHRRELAILRYIGASMQQVTQLIQTQALLLTASGYGGGLVLGYGLALLLVQVINLQSFGWTIPFRLPWDQLALLALALFLFAWVAALWPIRLVKRLEAPQTLRAPL